MDSVFPLDSALNLPRGKYSHGLRKAVAEAVIEHAFDGVLALLDQLGGGHIGKRQAEEVQVRHFRADCNNPPRDINNGYLELRLE